MNRSKQSDTARSPQVHMKHMQGSQMMGQASRMHPGMMSMHRGQMHGMHQKGMMGMGQKGMHQGMPGMMHMMMVKKLPMMQDELNLEPQQVKSLIDMKADFMKKKVDLRQNLMEQRKQVHNMVMEDASTKDYKSQLMSFYESRVDMQAAAHETYKQMKEVLNDQQQKKLDEKFQKCPYMKEGSMKRPFHKGVDEGMDEMH
ncbi:MAG TPA: hypothetical protein VJ876_02000 [Bacteroidales bacterium]|nr:hypothetical protein [Bacteroidales bacterium]